MEDSVPCLEEHIASFMLQRLQCEDITGEKLKNVLRVDFHAVGGFGLKGRKRVLENVTGSGEIYNFKRL